MALPLQCRNGLLCDVRLWRCHAAPRCVGHTVDCFMVTTDLNHQGPFTLHNYSAFAGIFPKQNKRKHIQYSSVPLVMF